MKKFLKMLTLTLCLTILFTGCGCGNSKVEKTSVELADDYQDNYVLLDASKLTWKLKNKDTFMLYVKADGCEGCNIFNPIVQKAIKERNILLYVIDSYEYDKKDFGLIVEYTPTFIIYNKGEIRYHFVETNKDESKYFTSIEGFYELLDNYVTLTKPKSEKPDGKVEIRKPINVDKVSYDEFSTIKDLKDMLASRDNTLLLFIKGSDYESKEFDKVINQLLQDNKGVITMFEIGKDEFAKGELLPISYGPSFVIYQYGHVVCNIDSLTYSNVFNSLENFKELIKDYVNFVDKKGNVTPII